MEDVNDNAPDLSHEYRPIIQENISPTKIVEVHAKDKDDTLKKNSAPYTFEMDPTVDDVIKTSFIVEYNPSLYIPIDSLLVNIVFRIICIYSVLTILS